MPWTHGPAHVEVRSDPGRGPQLVATVACKRGDVLALYRADGFVTAPGRRILQQVDWVVPQEVYLCNSVNVAGCEGIAQVFADPSRHEFPWCAHVVRDAVSKPFSEKLKTRGEFLRAAIIYMDCSLKRANAIFAIMSRPISLVANTDIAPGEEVFVSYGPAHWLQQVPASAMPDGLTPENIYSVAMEWGRQNMPEAAARIASALDMESVLAMGVAHQDSLLALLASVGLTNGKWQEETAAAKAARGGPAT